MTTTNRVLTLYEAQRSVSRDLEAKARGLTGLVVMPPLSVLIGTKARGSSSSGLSSKVSIEDVVVVANEALLVPGVAEAV